jgi:hypothetical protein
MSDSYAQTIAERYKGEVVDLYLGDSNGNQYWAEYEVNKSSFVRGKIIDGHGDMLIMQCQVFTDSDAHTFEVAINGYNIKMCCPLRDHNDKFNITRLMLDNRDTSAALSIRNGRAM